MSETMELRAGGLFPRRQERKRSRQRVRLRNTLAYALADNADFGGADRAALVALVATDPDDVKAQAVFDELALQLEATDAELADDAGAVTPKRDWAGFLKALSDFFIAIAPVLLQVLKAFGIGGI